MKKPMPEQGREDELKVQPKGNARGLPDLQAEQERQRAEHASAGDRTDQKPPAFSGDPPDGSEMLLEDRSGSDPERGPEIEKPGELEWRNAIQDRFAQGGGGTEQDRGENDQEDRRKHGRIILTDFSFSCELTSRAGDL